MVKIVLSLLAAILLGCLASGSKCPEQDSITRHVLCYYEGRTPINNINLCNCTHIILTNAVRVTNNYTLDFIEDSRKNLDVIKDTKPTLSRIFTLNGNGKLESNVFESTNKSRQLANGIAEFLRQSEFNGVEVNLPLKIHDTVGKDSVTSFVKVLKKTLENSSHLRVKRGGYYVSENLEDDITTAPYRTPTARSVRSNEKQETNKKTNAKRRKNYRGTRYNRRDQEEEVESRTEKRSRRMRKELRENRGYGSTLLLVRLPTNPEVIAKKFDLKALSKYADFLTVSTNNITDDSEAKYTYHPSRLMGLSDMLNADSILDFLSGLGVEKSKIVLTLPATILKFRLEDAKKTTPRSVRIGEPEIIDQSQLCSLFSKGNWTVERDDDLTAPYAFSDKIWLAYEDRISVNIKAKYILLRELAGGAIYPIDADNGRDPCNDTTAGVGFLTNTLYKNVMALERKPRDLVLESLQQDIHNSHYSAVEAGVHQSEYRIVRVVDHTGAVHVIRKNTKTQFECSRQGYFSHPLGCNKFYRCVKFNQYTDDYTVFEYDCPAGLAFDERWEVCVWPGSLPHGAPCTGSSEIAPVPRSHYQCPNQEGYYADPENCRWFFACLDHARDGVTPLTAYEFRCPFGLVFNEQKLVCDWPWNVGVCGNRGFSGVILEHHVGSSAALQSATFGAYEPGNGAAAGSGFAHSSDYEGSFGASAGSAHSGNAFSGHSGTGYIAGHFEDNQERASFGTVPEYEISGGRILNRGGLILNQNVNLHGVSSASGSSNFNAHSSSFESGRGDAGHVSFSAGSPVVHSVQTVTPSPALKTLNLVYNPPLSTPRPFSVSVPEVQVNQEQHSVDFAYVGGSTTSSPETVVYASGAKSDNSGNLHTFTVSSESGEYVRDDTGFGDKVEIGIAAGQGFHAVKNAGVHVTTAAPIHQVEVQGVNTVSGGYDGVSFVSGTAAGYDSGAAVVGKTISVSPEVYQVSNSHVTSGGENSHVSYGVPSSTPSPQVHVHNAGVSEATVLVTPKPELHTYQLSGDLHKTTGLSAVNVASVGLYSASNGSDSLVHRPVVQITNVEPQYYHESSSSGSGYSANSQHSFSVNSASSGLDNSNYASKSAGDGILLEEHIERVVVPKVVSSPAPALSYEQPGLSVKSTVVSSTPKPSFFAAVTPSSQVTLERQNFIGPITFTRQKGAFRQSVVSTAAPAVYSGPEYLPPVKTDIVVQQGGSQYRPSVQEKLVESVVSTPSPAVLNSNYNYNFGGRYNSKVNIVEPVVQHLQTPVVEELKVVSSPAPASFKGPEYLPPVESSITVQQNAKDFVQPVKFTASAQFPSAVSNSQYSTDVAQGQVNTGVSVQQVDHVATGQVDSGLSVVQQNVQTYQQTPITETKFVSSTPSPAVFGRSEYVAVRGLQGQSVQQNQQQTFSQGPVVEQVEIVQPVVSTPAPAVFKRPQYYGFGTSQGRSEVRSGSHTYAQVPFVQDVKVVQPVVSSPAPAVFRRPQYFGYGTSQGNTEVKSSVQQNVQTYLQVPVVEEVKVAQPVVSTPEPAVYKQQEYINFGGVRGQKSSVQQNIQTYSKVPVVEEINVIQPVVSTPAPAVSKQQEYVAVGGVQGQKSVQQNIATYSQVPVVEDIKVVQPVVSTPAPAAIKEEYDSPVKSSINIQQNSDRYRPFIQTQFVSTPAPAVFSKTEYVSSGLAGLVDSGRNVLKSTVQNAQTEYKGPEYLPPLLEQNAELKSEVQRNLEVYSQPQVEVNYAQPVVSTVPTVASVRNNHVQSVILENARDRQHFVQTPIRTQTYNFVPSTTITPVVYEQKQETVSFSPINVRQELYRSRPKSKQLFSSVVKPQVSLTYQGPQIQGVLYSKSTPAPFTLKSPSPTPAQIFGYQSTSGQLTDIGLSSPKPAIYIEEIKSVNTVDHTTPRPYVYEEYVEISSPKPTDSSARFEESSIRVQQPIVVTGKPVFVQPKTIQQKGEKTIYYEDRSNPVLTALEKEVVQPVVQQQTYTVSTESPVLVNDYEEVVNYVPPTGEEINSYSNFEFQKVGKAKTGVLVQTGGVRSQTYETGNDYKVNTNIQIAPPSEEYILSVTPKLVTTTVAPTTAAPIETSTVYRARARPTTSTEKYVLVNDYSTDYRESDDSGKATIFSVGEVDKDELEDDNVESLLQKYSGDFGNVLGREKFVTKVVQGEGRGQFVLGNQQEASTIGYEVSTSRAKSRGSYKSTYKEEERASEDTASLDLKNLKIKKNKKTVIIVSQVSDANPLLIGKLAGQCSCQSNKLQIRKKVRVNGRTTTTSTTHSPLEEEVTSESVLDSLAIEAVTPSSSTENVILIDGSRSAGKAPVRKVFVSRKGRPSGRSRAQYGDVTGNEISQSLLSPVPADEIAGTSDYSTNQIGSHGAAFDRYGPGGLRGSDETLQGGVNCERPGLFRHPKYCNKFYACNYDPWKKRYTLHVFNCPIHLSYDSSISACNWPSKGPACSDDHLLV